jgi:hypothetical protein
MGTRHPAGPRRVDQDQAATWIVALRYGDTAMIIDAAQRDNFAGHSAM